MGNPRRFREHLPFAPRHEQHFRWRGKEVSRIEGFSDAVFGFAVTLLVVALEVPRSFEGLMNVIRGFPAFMASFILLMLFWNAHYKFFRRYGLDDAFVRWVNLGILLMVLFSVYPLKFVFFAWLGGEHDAALENGDQLKTIFRYYGFGFACLWSLFALLYWYALRQTATLRLTVEELILTRTSFIEFSLQLAVCALSIALTFAPVHPAVPGFTYMLVGPLLTWNGFRSARLIRTFTDGRA